MDGGLFGLCAICGGNDLRAGEDGFFYCSACGSQSQQYQEQNFDYEDGNIYTRYASKVRAASPPVEDGANRKSLLDEEDHLPGNTLFSTDIFPEDAAPWQQIIMPTPRKRKRCDNLFDPVHFLESIESPIRTTYLLGLQKILEWQCETLVEKHGVSAAICGIVGPIWFRFVASSRVLERDWGKETIFHAASVHEERKRGKGSAVMKIKKKKRMKKGDGSNEDAVRKKTKKSNNKDRANNSNDSCEANEDTMKKKKQKKKAKKGRGNDSDSEKDRDDDSDSENGRDNDSDNDNDSDESEEIEDLMLETRRGFKHTLLVCLRKRIPLHVTLAIVFMACHLAQEPILATDIVEWAVNGSLPYLNAFIRLETEDPGFTWPIAARVIFKPNNVTSARVLEHSVAFIAKRIGLRLPPVNFRALTIRFLKELHLPVDKVAVYASRLYDWYAPPELYFSDHMLAIPPRVYVMSMLIIVIKILYQLDGQWYWEQEQKPKPKRNPKSKCIPRPKKELKGVVQIPVDLDGLFCPRQLLENLENLWDRRSLQFEYENDLRPYLDYCQKFIIPDFKVDIDGQSVCDQLWQLFEHPPEKVCGDSPNEVEGLSMSEAQSLSGDSHFSFTERYLHRETVSNDKDSQKSVAEAETPVAPDVDSLQESNEPSKQFRSLPELIRDMEELGFSCLPPRTKSYPPGSYVKYFWRPDDEPKAIHADYFILLCACAKVVKVHPMALFWCVGLLDFNLRRIEMQTDAKTT